MDRTSPAAVTVTPKMRAEASAWIARLHGPERDARTEAGFRNWLDASPSHSIAFEQTTEAWESIGSVSREPLSSMVRWDLIGTEQKRNLTRPVLAFAATILLAIGSYAAWNTYLRNVYQTGVGEQRTLTLADGSRVQLNTATRMKQDYSRTARRIDLESGEALFEVARDPNRPFIVVAGNRTITAIGTQFTVRHDAEDVAVTLIEGKIAVSTRDKAAHVSHPAILIPGQRLTLVKNTPPRVDTPALERVTAWQRGLVILDATPLHDAVAEMNRYSAVPLEIASAEAEQLRISGAFRAGDSMSFAQAVASTYDLKVSEDERRIRLDGAPRRTY